MKNVDELRLFGDSLMEHFAKQVGQASFKNLSTVVTNSAMESSFNQ